MVKREAVSVTELIPIIEAAIYDGKPVEMTVTGRSMMPLLKDRISSVRFARPDDLKKGDIVLFRRSDGHFVLHRIKSCHGDVYDIVGDNQYMADVNVSERDIIAKVKEFNRTGKRWEKDDRLYRAILPVIRLAGRCLKKVKRKLVSILN